MVYHETVEKDSSKWMADFPTFDEEHYFSVEKECALTFKRSDEMMSANDYRFNAITKIDGMLKDATDEDYDEYDQIMEEHYEIASGQGSKLGGYPFFTQEDPRAYEEYTEYDTLLLQIDTEEDLGIMWGDAGVANFFIAKENVTKRDFSKVLYNWDCH